MLRAIRGASGPFWRLGAMAIEVGRHEVIDLW
jgi:hypothetical protein